MENTAPEWKSLLPSTFLVGTMVYDILTDEVSEQACLISHGGPVAGQHNDTFHPFIRLAEHSPRRAWFTLIHEIVHAVANQAGLSDIVEPAVVAVENAVGSLTLENAWWPSVLTRLRETWLARTVERTDLLDLIGRDAEFRYGYERWHLLQDEDTARRCRHERYVAMGDWNEDVIRLDRGHALSKQITSLFIRAIEDTLNDYDLKFPEGAHALVFSNGLLLFFLQNDWTDALLEKARNFGRNA